jgi:trk system potassium uptake protein TrkH
MPSKKPRTIHPNHIVIASFLCVILVGAVLLRLPVSAAKTPVSVIDALFTCTSATCVTGLTVVDTGTVYSRFGQIVTCILIQVGGLGITTFSTFFLFILGGRVSLRGRGIVEASVTQFPVQNAGQLLGKILLVTVAIEGMGAVLLYPLLNGPERSGFFPVFTAIYHSVSAYCNAGLSLYATNLEAYRQNVGVNLVMAGLIMTGGIGFIVLVELWEYFFRHPRKKRLSFHTKFVLTITGMLILIGTIVFLLLEWNNTLADLSFGHKVLASFFQVVTPRTAGFNTVPMGSCASATLFFLILLMFIGASPGSCGGGIKTTSFGVLLGLAISKLKGSDDVNFFSRRVPDDVISRAISVAVFSFFAITVLLMVTCITEAGLAPKCAGGRFLGLVFELTSAFGTVGLSTGITPHLSNAGKLLVTLLMMIGRLGPLTIAIALTARESRPRFRYAEESLMIG